MTRLIRKNRAKNTRASEEDFVVRDVFAKHEFASEKREKQNIYKYKYYNRNKTSAFKISETRLKTTFSAYPMETRTATNSDLTSSSVSRRIKILLWCTPE